MTDLIKELQNRESARLVYNRKTLEILGFFYEWRAENPNAIISMNSDYGTFNIGYKVVSLHKYETEAIEKLGLTDIHKDMIKRRQKRIEKERAEAEKIAKPILDKMESDLETILSKNNCSLSYSLEGDTHGVDSYLYISTTINGYEFERKINE